MCAVALLVCFMVCTIRKTGVPCTVCVRLIAVGVVIPTSTVCQHRTPQSYHGLRDEEECLAGPSLIGGLSSIRRQVFIFHALYNPAMSPALLGKRTTSHTHYTQYSLNRHTTDHCHILYHTSTLPATWPRCPKQSLHHHGTGAQLV